MRSRKNADAQYWMRAPTDRRRVFPHDWRTSHMKKFLHLYFGGNPPESEEAGKAVMADWMA